MNEINGVQSRISAACAVICAGGCFIDGLAPMDFVAISVGYQD